MDENEGKHLEYESLRTEILRNDVMCQVFSLLMIVTAAIVYVVALNNWFPIPLLFVLPLLYVCYQQLLFHKYEGTARIAAYLAVFHEGPGTGRRWESRLANVRKPNDPLFAWFTHIENILLAISLGGPLYAASELETKVMLVLCLAVLTLCLFRNAGLARTVVSFHPEFLRIRSEEERAST